MILKNSYAGNILTEKVSCMLKTKIKLLSLASAVMVSYSSLSMAGLYIYPVAGENSVNGAGGAEGRYNSSYHSSGSATYSDTDNMYNRGQTDHEFYRSSQGPAREADMTVNNSHLPSRVRLPCYGKEVPLPIAMKEISGTEYVVNYPDSISKSRVSWSGAPDECSTRASIARLVAASNGYYAHVNSEEMAIGLGMNKDEAYHHAFIEPKVWYSDPTLSVSENLTKWAEAEGWKVQWPEIMSEIDFEAAGTTLYGDLVGPDGVFHKVLQQIAKKHHDVVLSVKFYKNNYIVVEEGGYEINPKGNE